MPTGIVAAVVLLVIVAGAIGYLRYRTPAGPTMLAVLPFETAGDTADAWITDGITDGITDEVRGKLAGLSSLRVIARSSSNRYRRSTKPPEEIGRELGVRYLLMGRIRWAPGTGAQRQIRVEPELVQVADVATPQTKWEQPFDEQQSDVFRLQSDIAERVASALQVALNPAERVAISQPSTRNPDAYYAYLRGVALNRTESPNDDARARQEFRRAVTLDSTFADAWIALADNISRWAARHITTAAFQDSSRAAADRAQAIEPDHPEVIDSRAFYDELIRHDLPKAYAEYREVVEKSPSSSRAIRAMAELEVRLGHWDSALVHLERSAQLSPRDASAFNELGNTYLLVRRYGDARRATAQAYQLNPTNILTTFSLIQIPLAQGDMAGARAAVRAASPGIDSLTLYAFLAQYGSYTWVLDTNQQRALLGVPPSAYDRGHSAWAAVRMLLYDELGDSAASKAYADSAAVGFQADNHGHAADSEATYGWALAVAGRRTEAIAAADSYLKANPIERDYLDNVDNAEDALKAYVRGGATTKALDLLDRLLHIPGRLTPGRIRLDPAFAPLRGDPRFQRLATTRAAGE
jgi:TolB-like protein